MFLAKMFLVAGTIAAALLTSPPAVTTERIPERPPPATTPRVGTSCVDSSASEPPARSRPSDSGRHSSLRSCSSSSRRESSVSMTRSSAGPPGSSRTDAG
jgi:hypothetical protein